MALLELNLNPSRKELKWFAGVWFPAFWGVAGFLLWRRHHVDIAYALWTCAALLSVVGLIRQPLIRPFYILMMRFSYPLGWVMSHLMLFVAWGAVITPVGWLIRRFHDPMQRQLTSDAKSYWIPWENSDRDSYFRQF